MRPRAEQQHGQPARADNIVPTWKPSRSKPQHAIFVGLSLTYFCYQVVEIAAYDRLQSAMTDAGLLFLNLPLIGNPPLQISPPLEVKLPLQT